ncbi:MAG: GTP-binding protein [Bacteroidota bacterium]
MPTSSHQSAKPTTILTGFLGAGKTTYLNFLLTKKSRTRYAIIENEYGEQSIDSDLIIRAEDEIVELNNGCLCCTLNENLYEILNSLFDRRDEYDEIVIEATGVANPAGLAEPFVSHPAIKQHFPLTNIICLIDAELIEGQLAETEEAIGQITYSDVLLVNKTDLVREEHLTRLVARLQRLNPLAKIVLGNKTSFPDINVADDEALFNELYHKSDHAKAHHHDKKSFPVSSPHSHFHHHHTDEVVSHTFTFDRPFVKQSLYHQLHAYLVFQSRGLYRMKGLVWIKDSNQQHLIQSVGKRLDTGEKRTWGPGEEKLSRIVFIGKDLARKGLERLLNRCFV